LPPTRFFISSFILHHHAIRRHSITLTASCLFRQRRLAALRRHEQATPRLHAGSRDDAPRRARLFCWFLLISGQQSDNMNAGETAVNKE